MKKVVEYINDVIAIDVWLNLRYNLAIERSTYHADSSNERFKEYCRNRA